jgi:hypothetical protein
VFEVPDNGVVGLRSLNTVEKSKFSAGKVLLLLLFLLLILLLLLLLVFVVVVPGMVVVLFVFVKGGNKSLFLLVLLLLLLLFVFVKPGVEAIGSEIGFTFELGGFDLFFLLEKKKNRKIT